MLSEERNSRQMRIVSFLLPFPCKYSEAPYLSTFFRQLSGDLPETTLHVLGQEYLDWHRFKARWEFEEWNQWFHEYRLPAQSPKHTQIIDERLFQPLLERCVTPVRVWRHLILERYEPLEAVLEQSLERAQALFGGIDCVLSWLNLASMRHLCQARGIPIVHNEHGPLRKPAYRHTAYFDFQGVNGHTDAAREFAEFSRELGTGFAWPLLAQLQDVFLLEASVDGNAEMRPQYACGVAAQLEEDSNLIAYANGFTCLELIRYCQSLFGPDQTLIRPHPMAIGLYCGRIDASPSAAAFIRRCREVHTINSSVAAECLLLGKRFVIYGDSPLNIATRARAGSAVVRESLPDQEGLAAATFFFLSYLIPYGLLFDSAYYQWRLAMPSHLQRMIAHLRYYAGVPFSPPAGPSDDDESAFRSALAGFAGPARAAQQANSDSEASRDDLAVSGIVLPLREFETLTRERDALERQLAKMLQSRSWKLTAPLRWLDARLGRRR